MGLVNAVVPHEQLDAEVQRWCDEIMRAQPDRDRDRQTFLQHGHRAPGRHRRHGHVCALKLYYDTEESREGVRAFQEKRAPDFRRHAK